MRLLVRSYTILAMMIVATVGYAQQAPQWTQYMLNQYAINPAYAGLDRSLSVSLGIRSQWTSFDGGPRTQIFNGHLPLYFLNGAAGLTMVNDDTGLLRRTSVAGSYNYVFVADRQLLSFGAKLGVQQVALAGDEIRTPDGVYQDGSINHFDPILPTNLATGYTPIWSLAGYFTGGGISIGIVLDNIANSTVAGAAQFSENQVFTLLAAYKMSITEKIDIEPNLLLKTDLAETQLDLGVLGYYEQFVGGIGIRGYSANTFDALHTIIGVKVSERVRLSYAFDIGLSGIADRQDGTHEFLVNYNLNKPIRTGEPPKIIYNPRFN